MFVNRGDGTRVRIPNDIEAQGEAAVAEFVAKATPDHIVPAEPEVIPAEERFPAPPDPDGYPKPEATAPPAEVPASTRRAARGADSVDKES